MEAALGDPEREAQAVVMSAEVVDTADQIQASFQRVDLTGQSAAALCEPALLADPAHVRAVLDLLYRITASLAASEDRRKQDDFIALRKGLGYCWSVAIAALPDDGESHFERWLSHPNPDVRWIVRENLRKTRLSRMDAAWVARCQAQIGAG
jgi:hypothetical protein